MQKLIYILISALLLFGSCKKEDLDTEKKYGSIEATITDQSNGDLLYNAYVLIVQNGMATPTGSDGRFVFAQVKEGKCNLQVFKENYVSTTHSIDVVAGKTVQPNIRIVKSIGNLNMNKAYLDFSLGNIQNFTITNHGQTSLQWEVSNNCDWITVTPNQGSLNAESSQAINVSVDKSAIKGENYATISVTASDGFASTILLTTGMDGNGGAPTFMQVGNIHVQKQDITTLSVNWESAKYYCEHSNVGGYSDWRLPTLVEMQMIYSNKDVIGGFKDTSYWTSDNFSSVEYYTKHFGSGKETYFRFNSTLKVRAVRSLR
ncbi:MAG TPA: DUF1566 domain-containing protein [Bacteroidales bacterium]|nr:DUF1566 domain-containing protein [Bacteroidales bacterium]HPL05387.1 DUF1566 domain-containing protein [Bacteroidales bacterium]